MLPDPRGVSRRHALRQIATACAGGALITSSLKAAPAFAQGAYPGTPAPAYPPPAPSTYDIGEIVNAGHQAFGRASTEIASAVEYTFASRGQPTGYVVGQEAGAAFFGGLRYGEGELRMKSGTNATIFWQGPSLGLDVGAEGSRILILVYNLTHPQQIFDIYAGPSGLAYAAGGVGVSFHNNDQDLALAVIRTGVGLRIGINIGYIRVTPQPTWNPF